ncbi:UbiA prenyltransferase family protein [Natrinema saccharevitans]|uniref:UbiA family prenyltransferase n=1 Tax=Natrinema saccharevitans TaxID=301967 RepID=UPI001FE9FA16|nr:UbiA family prenyltransferase [Natrinema saccharevitans]
MNTRTTHVALLLNLWLCIGAVLMLVITILAVGIPFSTIGIGLLLPALAVYFIYVEDRRQTSPEDRINNTYRTALVEQFNKPLFYTSLTAVSIYQTLTLFFAIKQSSISYVLIAVLVAQLPLIFIYTYDYSKRYPVIDSSYVAITWAVLILFPVFLSTPQQITPSTVGMFVSWFLIVFAGVESRNISDVAGDDEVDRTTVASILGPNLTKYLVWILKLSALFIIYALGGLLPTLLTVLYLLYLRFFRRITQAITPSRKYHAGDQISSRNYKS